MRQALVVLHVYYNPPILGEGDERVRPFALVLILLTQLCRFSTRAHVSALPAVCMCLVSVYFDQERCILPNCDISLEHHGMKSKELATADQHHDQGTLYFEGLLRAYKVADLNASLGPQSS